MNTLTEYLELRKWQISAWNTVQFSDDETGRAMPLLSGWCVLVGEVDAKIFVDAYNSERFCLEDAPTFTAKFDTETEANTFIYSCFKSGAIPTTNN